MPLQNAAIRYNSFFFGHGPERGHSDRGVVYTRGRPNRQQRPLLGAVNRKRSSSSGMEQGTPRAGGGWAGGVASQLGADGPPPGEEPRHRRRRPPAERPRGDARE